MCLHPRKENQSCWVVSSKANFATELAGSAFRNLLCCQPAELLGFVCWYLITAPCSL